MTNRTIRQSIRAVQVIDVAARVGAFNPGTILVCCTPALVGLRAGNVGVMLSIGSLRLLDGGRRSIPIVTELLARDDVSVPEVMDTPPR